MNDFDFADIFGTEPVPEPEAPRDPIVPAGWQTLRIRGVERKSNDRGWVGLSVECEHGASGMRHWQLYTTQHHKPRVVEIGVRQFQTLVWACGFDKAPSGPRDLIGQEFDAKIKHKPDDYSGGMRSDIVAYERAGAKAGGEASTETFGDIPF